MSAALIALIVIVLLLAFGFGALGFALSVLWSLVWYGVVGLIIGGLARLVVSGRQDLTVFETALVGIAGSLLGGIVANDFLDVGWIGQFLTAVIIAALLVLAFAHIGVRAVWTIIQTCLILGSVLFATGLLGEQIAGQRAEVRELRRQLDELKLRD